MAVIGQDMWKAHKAIKTSQESQKEWVWERQGSDKLETLGARNQEVKKSGKSISHGRREVAEAGSQGSQEVGEAEKPREPRAEEVKNLGAKKG